MYHIAHCRYHCRSVVDLFTHTRTYIYIYIHECIDGTGTSNGKTGMHERSSTRVIINSLLLNIVRYFLIDNLASCIPTLFVTTTCKYSTLLTSLLCHYAERNILLRVKQYGKLLEIDVWGPIHFPRKNETPNCGTIVYCVFNAMC